MFAVGDTTRKGNRPLGQRGLSGDPTRANEKLGKEFADLRIKLYVAEIRRHLSELK